VHRSFTSVEEAAPLLDRRANHADRVARGAGVSRSTLLDTAGLDTPRRGYSTSMGAAAWLSDQHGGHCSTGVRIMLIE
jgi:hypothetical protein